MYNVRKTAIIVKGLYIKKEEEIEDKKLLLYNPYKRSKPLYYIRKKVDSYILRVYNKIYINVVIISL